jgi:hypothetical protein
MVALPETIAVVQGIKFEEVNRINRRICRDDVFIECTYEIIIKHMDKEGTISRGGTASRNDKRYKAVV